MGLRYYDPEAGRWTQKDSLNLFQDPRQGNRYLFAGGDPVNRVDPSGKFGIPFVDIETDICICFGPETGGTGLDPTAALTPT